MERAAVALPEKLGFLLDGHWLTEGPPVEIQAPANGQVITAVIRPSRLHVEAAIQAAARAFETTRKVAAFERQRVLRYVAAGLAARREEFARTLALEAGKPLRAARIEVERAVFTFQVAAEESTRI